MLDGAARIKDMVQSIKADGQKALGLTDHGNLYGVLDMYKACKESGITPVLGTELYQAKETQSERPVKRSKQDDGGGENSKGEKLYYHLIALAENNQGYQNLIKLSSDAFLDGFFYKPRCSWETLEKYHEGIIVTTGCLGGLTLQALLKNDYQKALETAARLQDIFGKDNMFVEIQDHGIAEQIKTNPQLIKIAQQLDAPLLATNDTHYVNYSDNTYHDALICLQTNSYVSDEDRFKFSSDQHYLKSAAEMRDVFRDYPQACDNTLWIAERSNVEIEFGKTVLPHFPLPEGYTSDDAYLRSLTLTGASKRYGSPLPANVAQRIDYELGVISKMGFSAYFLIVWDLMEYAKASRIRRGPGRGSAAGACVTYSLGITDLDPIKYELIFERFLNPSRVSMPDIDLDIDSRYRDQLIQYARDKYGWDHVAQIITYSSIKSRSAVKDSARVLGYPYEVGAKISKALPPLIVGRDTPLKYCFEKDVKHMAGYKMAAELRKMYEADAEVKHVIDIARGLEGLRRSDGIHASAVVITKDPLVEYLPIQRKPLAGGKAIDGPIVTQYDLHGVEDLGLLKMDFLGLRNLDVIEMALDYIEKTHGERIDVDSIALDDERVFDMLKAGHSIGVFQLEGGAMRVLMQSLAPTAFEDLAALVALYRPGPMAANMHNDFADRKNGRKGATYIHPDMEDLLKDTQGLMIYQESLMRVAQKFAGYSLAEADNLRKAAGKKLPEMMAKERDKFIAGCVKTGYTKDLGKNLFDMIEPFADYAFPRAHAFAYGYIAYQTAWLKVHYPSEYMAALLESVRDDQDATAKYLSEARRSKVRVLAPDINLSEGEFTVLNGEVPFGLTSIRNIKTAAQKIIAERNKNGPFLDFYDFCNRVDSKVLNKKVITSLIKAGAFDNLGYKRKGLEEASAAIVAAISTRRKKESHGQFDLFSTVEEPVFEEKKVEIPNVEWKKLEKLAIEKEMLGLYVSDHPLFGVEHALKRMTDCSIIELKESGSENPYTLGGIITGLNKKYTKKGALMAVFTLEDLDSSIEVIIFPKTMKSVEKNLEDGKIICVRGRQDLQEDMPKFIGLDITAPQLEQDPESFAEITFKESLDKAELAFVKQALVENRGKIPTVLHLPEKSYKLGVEFHINSIRRIQQILTGRFKTCSVEEKLLADLPV